MRWKLPILGFVSVAVSIAVLLFVMFPAAIGPSQPGPRAETQISAPSTSQPFPTHVVARAPVASVIKEQVLHAESEIADVGNELVQSVTGELFSPKGDVIGREKLVLTSNRLGKHYSTYSNESGYFVFNDIAIGADYRLKLSPSGPYRRLLIEDVSITKDQPHLYIKLEQLPSTTLLGTIVNAGRQPIPYFEMRVRSREKSGWVQTIRSNSIGEFFLDNVPAGKVEFSSMLGEMWSSRGHYLDPREIRPIALVADHGYHEVAGLVLDNYNEPVPGANILVSWKRSSDEVSASSYRRTITNPNGLFAVEGVGPGKHELIVSDSSGGAYRKNLDLVHSYTHLTVILESKL